MKQFSKYTIIGIICFSIWIISTILQVTNPHPYRGLVGNLILVVGILFILINDIIKSPLYDQNKTKHFRNWIFFYLN